MVDTASVLVFGVDLNWSLYSNNIIDASNNMEMARYSLREPGYEKNLYMPKWFYCPYVSWDNYRYDKDAFVILTKPRIPTYLHAPFRETNLHIYSSYFNLNRREVQLIPPRDMDTISKMLFSLTFTNRHLQIFFW